MYDKNVKLIECGNREIMYLVGTNGVKEIKYHAPRGEGDRHYVDVMIESGETVRVFDLNSVTFDNQDQSKERI